MEQNTNEPKNWLSRFFQKNNKVIAREFIFLVFGIIVCALISFGLSYKNDLISKHNQVIQDKIDKLNLTIPHRKELWIVMTDNGLYNDSYEKFKTDYKETEDQTTLYHLAQNNKLFEGDLHDFRFKYFPRDLAIEEAIHLYNNRYFPHIDKFTFLSNLNEEATWKKAYDLFVKDGYRHTMEDFKKLLTEDIYEQRERSTDALKVKLKNLNTLKSEMKDYYYHNYTIEVFLCGFLLLFGLRYLVYLVKWSLKQYSNI